MKKNLFLLAAAALTFAACSNDEYLGTAPAGVQEGQGGAITFSGLPGNITRAAQNAATSAATLKYNFSVLGTKSMATGDPINVFAKTSYVAAGIPDVSLYDVWYGKDVTNNSTTTNPKIWDYVGTGATLPDETSFSTSTQEIKYWDYAATKYDFIAYANTQNIATDKITNVTTTGFTVEATPGQVAGLYVADTKTVTSDDYNTPVTFKFRAAGAKVRLGIYETIPGYEVTSISFTVGSTTTDGVAHLTGSFVGSGVGDVNAQSFKVTTGDDEMTVVPSSNSYTAGIDFNFGNFVVSATSGSEMKTSSTNPTWANNGKYVDVFPNTANTGNMTLKVNYTLTHNATGEEIKVTNATAVVPKAYMAWHPNHKYTYLFKISDNTNGYTGNSSIEGLYPITFDAEVIETEDAEGQGTITTVSNPSSITTYAESSVSNAGITYTTATTPICATVDEATADLSDSNFKVYKAAKDNVTEAELAKGVGTTTTVIAVNYPNTETTVGDVVLTANKHAQFTLTTAGTYYIQYGTAVPYAYKVIKVAAPVAP